MQIKNLSHALSIKKTSYATNKTVSPINTHKNLFQLLKMGDALLNSFKINSN